jgi:hypothetical protein
VTNNTNYKALRLYEMSQMWVGTSLEPHTVRLLAMLLVEDGSLTAERRHDCHSNGVCYAIGIQGHHICYRGKPLVYGGEPKKYCWWQDRDGDGRYETNPQRAFELDFPAFATDWREQFKEYTFRMTQCLSGGSGIDGCIQSWNSRESGRLSKVKSRENYVREALGLL